MPISTQHKTTAKAWANSLLNAVPATLTGKQAQSRINLAVQQLVMLFPIEAFTEASVVYVARGLTEFPSDDTLIVRLRQWWSDHAPAAGSASLPGIEDPALTVEDRCKLQTWLKFRAEEFAHLEEFGNLRRRMQQSLSSHRRHPKVFRYICRHDPEAADIAIAMGWAWEAEPELTEAQRAEMSVSAQRAIHAMKAQSVYNAARPHNPDHEAQTIEEAAAYVEKITRAHYASLTPEQLEQARAHAGIRTRPAAPAMPAWDAPYDRTAEATPASEANTSEPGEAEMPVQPPDFPPSAPVTSLDTPPAQHANDAKPEPARAHGPWWDDPPEAA